ncbi:hypothetical protein NMG60_11033281 [Bertholletia excelsa]
MNSPSRKLLQGGDALRSTKYQYVTLPPQPDPILQPATANLSSPLSRPPLNPRSPLDSSMALTALVLLTAFVFVGFFSLYLRRYSYDSSASLRRRRGQLRGPPQYFFSGAPAWRLSPPKGLDPSTVRTLPLVVFSRKGKQADGDCPICLSEFEEGESVKLIPCCSHVFHPCCVDKWLSSHVTCPVCRSTKISAEGERRLGVDDHCQSDDRGRSTVENGETWVDQSGEVGPVGIRRVCSCSSLGDRVVALHRSLSI